MIGLLSMFCLGIGFLTSSYINLLRENKELKNNRKKK